MMKLKKHLITTVAAFAMLCIMCGIFASCSLFATTISLDKTELNMFVGDSIKLAATVSDKEAEVEWSTSNDKVVTVRRGTVTAVGVGTAVITAKVEDGASASCTITVSERTVSISQTSATINLDEGNTLTLTATASDNGEITWTSSDPSVATVANGVVTAYDIGSVTITAQRGKATATCVVEVVEPSRPADYYHITKLTNSEVVADPGVWHYHADGSMGGDYGFSATPLHKNATASATLNVIPKVENSQYFYFRYQPDQVELNSYYTISVTITVSEDATLRIGSRRVDGSKFASLEIAVEANVPKTVEYIGYKNEYEPFSVRINSEVDAEEVTLSVQLNSVAAHNGENLPEYHTKVEETPKINYEELPKDESDYDLEPKTNAEAIASPDKWHYNQGESSIVSSAKYDNGTITLAFETLQNMGNSQLRFRPTLPANTKIKIEFTVTSNVASKVVLALCDVNTFAASEWNEKKLDGTNSVTFLAEVTLKESQLIFIQVQAADEVKSNASFTFSDIKIYKEVEVEVEEELEQPEDTVENGYFITYGNKATTRENAGTWFYFADGAEGTDFAFSAKPKIDNGVITLSISTLNASYMALRYQPDFEVGTEYTISFTVEVDAACKILYGTDYKVYTFSEAGSQTITWTGAVDGTETFMIQVKECTAPISVTVSGITITEVTEDETEEEPEQPEDTVENGYFITYGNKATTRENAGTWFYFADGAEGTDFAFSAKPKIDNGVITLSISTLNASYMALRYQPDFEVGTEYTISFTVEVDAACKILYGTDYKVYTFSEAGSQTITWTGAVDGTETFMIQVKECTAPISIAVSGITITEVTEDEESVVYELTSSNNTGVVANPGTWFYMCDGTNGTDYELASTPEYENGTITFAFEKMAEGSPTYQLRYQPEYDQGTAYTVTFTVTVTAPGKIVYGTDYKSYEFTEAGTHTIEWTGTVGTSPFAINIRSTDRTAPITMTVSDITFSAN